MYRLLLRAYPRDFRDEYGQQMSLLFRARSGEGQVRLWFQVLVTLLGVIALLLGLIGIYGVVSYLVAQRTREFGIRVALGARQWSLPFAVVGQGLGYTVPGIMCGLLGAALVSNRIRALLFEVDARDPATFAVVGVTVVLVAAAACYVPARRAASVDPITVLRAE